MQNSGAAEFLCWPFSSANEELFVAVEVTKRFFFVKGVR